MDKIIVVPKGITNDILIKVDKLIVLSYFIVLDYDIDDRVFIIRGRLLLTIRGVLIDVR